MSFVTIKEWFLQFLQLQLFLTLWSLPFLVAWGLPVSIMTLVGNFIFLPFLMCFLILSTAITAGTLLHLPMRWVIMLLEWCTGLWTWLLEQGSSSWLKGFMRPHLSVLVIVPLLTTILLYLRWSSTIQRRISILLCSLGLFILVLHFLPPNKLLIKDIPCGQHHISIICCNSKTIVVDNGAIARKRDTQSWIEYSLDPALRRYCGTTDISHIIALKPSKRLFIFLCNVLEEHQLETIYLPQWHGTLDPELHILFEKLKQACLLHAVQLIFLTKTCALSLSKDTSVFLSPLAEYPKSGTLKYQTWQISVLSNEKKYILSSTKLKNGKGKL